jgi:hypothetical protein
MGNNEMDNLLMYFVNMLGLTTFVSIVVYHLITAKDEDAKL